MIGNKLTVISRIKNYPNNQSGVTLMELMVALSVFSFAMISAMGIFQSVVSGQSYAIASLNTQETLRYDFEMMSKEIRMAVKSTHSCVPTCGALSTANLFYNTDAGNNLLCFENEKNKCVKYYLTGNRLRISRESIGDYPITPDEVTVSQLVLSIQDAATIVSQPRVTMKLKIEAIGKDVNKQTMVLQQTASSRYYE